MSGPRTIKITDLSSTTIFWGNTLFQLYASQRFEWFVEKWQLIIVTCRNISDILTRKKLENDIICFIWDKFWVQCLIRGLQWLYEITINRPKTITRQAYWFPGPSWVGLSIVVVCQNGYLWSAHACQWIRLCRHHIVLQCGSLPIQYTGYPIL